MKKILLIALLAAGCGAANTPAPPTPVTPNANVSGQYDLALTSTSGHGTTNIYTNFTQTETTLTGAANTLVCPSNDLSQCFGNDAPVISITPIGTVDGTSVTMALTFPNMAGANSVSLVGTATGTSLAGTYTDSRGDVGTWTGSAASSLSANYTGTFNSTSNPLFTAPSIAITLAQDAHFNLTGTATITNSPCINSLTFSGQAIGEAFSVTDATSKAVIFALPTGDNFTFTYSFDPSAANCAGDIGRGTFVTNKSPWDY